MTNFIPDGSGQYLDIYDSDTFWSCVNPYGGTDYQFDRLATAIGECWEWLRGEHSEYGRFQTARGNEAAHRVAWKEVGRPLADDETLDHLCRNTKCVNPDHLENVTQAENVKRGLVANKTHCNHGHEFSQHNTVYRKMRGKLIRACYTCLSESRRKTYARSKQRKAA